MRANRSVAAALVIGLCAVSLFGLSDADFQTKDNEDGSVTIIGYTGWDKDVAIPAKLGGKAVTAIGKEAFNGADLTGVVIPDSVTTIGEKAFAGNKLAKLTIGKNVKTIEKGAFVSNKLTSVAIPNNVTISNNDNYSYGAFYNNPLTKVALGADCLFSVDAGFGYFAYYSYMCNGRKTGTYTVDAEWDKNFSSRFSQDYEKVKKHADSYVYAETPYGLAITDYLGDSKRLDVPDKLNGKPVKYIEGLGNYSYSEGLTGVRIPDSVVTIGNFAFASNQLTSGAIIGNGVTYIGGGAFYNCGLTSITIPDSVKVIADGIDQYSSRYGTFASNRLTSITIPNSVTYIGSSAFSNNQLTSVTIPNSVIYIGGSAFSDNQLTSVTIPDSVTSIGKSAFSDNQLTGVTIPANVSLGNKTFDGDFDRTYNDNGKKAGTYRYSNYTWNSPEVVAQQEEAARQQEEETRRMEQELRPKLNESRQKIETLWREIYDIQPGLGTKVWTMNSKAFNKFIEVYKAYQEYEKLVNDNMDMLNSRQEWHEYILSVAANNETISSIRRMYLDRLSRSQQWTFEKQFGTGWQ